VKQCAAIVCLAIACVGSGGAIAQAPVSATGLVEADGWELVYAHCSACHSLDLVVSQRGDRRTWLRLIRWMQDTQNLWEFSPQTEQRILEYLAANYPPGNSYRRAPLPPELMPGE
jgi:hypothetical protein